jgi:hypothetical protein
MNLLQSCQLLLFVGLLTYLFWKIGLTWVTFGLSILLLLRFFHLFYYELEGKLGDIMGVVFVFMLCVIFAQNTIYWVNAGFVFVFLMGCLETYLRGINLYGCIFLILFFVLLGFLVDKITGKLYFV